MAPNSGPVLAVAEITGVAIMAAMTTAVAGMVMMVAVTIAAPAVTDLYS
jgi:hypothetical protein